MPPLPPLDPSNTPRLYINYTSGGSEHTLELRAPIGTSTADMLVKYGDVAGAMAPVMDPTDSVLNGEYSNAGSNIRFPLGTLPYVGSGASTAITDISKSAFISNGGKGSDGRLTNWTFFSLGYIGINDTRLAISALGATTQALIAAVRNNLGFTPVNIGNAAVTWRSYANLGRNAHWQRKGR